MSVRIRLQLIGKRNQRQFNIVVADSRSPRNGKFIAKLGTYRTHTKPSTTSFNESLALEWLMKGAVPTRTVTSILRIKGILYKKHLLIGVLKGAKSKEQADKEFGDWQATRQAKLTIINGHLKEEKGIITDIEYSDHIPKKQPSFRNKSHFQSSQPMLIVKNAVEEGVMTNNTLKVNKDNIPTDAPYRLHTWIRYVNEQGEKIPISQLESLQLNRTYDLIINVELDDEEKRKSLLGSIGFNLSSKHIDRKDSAFTRLEFSECFASSPISITPLAADKEGKAILYINFIQNHFPVHSLPLAFNILQP